MGDQTRVILNHYNISTPYPTEWPAEKDDSDTSDLDAPIIKTATSNLRRSKSRYSVLERSGSDRRSLVPGSEKTRDGVENLVQKDEADPLGGTDSVVRALRQKGLPVEDDQRLREHFTTSGLPKLRRLREPLPSILDHVQSISLPLAGSLGNAYYRSYARP